MSHSSDKAVPHGASTNPPKTSPLGSQEANEDDDTVVVERRTRGRAAPPAQAVRRADVDDAADDLTVVVAKRGAAKGLAPAALTPTALTPTPPTPSPSMPSPQAPRRRGIAPPPAPLGFEPRAVKSGGANATENYRPRAIPEPPARHAPLSGGPPATRDAAAAMPSVARQSRITARAALFAFGLACAGSAVGLTLIALSYLRAR